MTFSKKFANLKTTQTKPSFCFREWLARPQSQAERQIFKT